MTRKEFDESLDKAKGEGYIAGQETRRMALLVDNERMDTYLETGKLPGKPIQVIKVRGTNPGWTPQEHLMEDPEENLRLRRPRRNNSSKTS